MNTYSLIPRAEREIEVEVSFGRLWSNMTTSPEETAQVQKKQGMQRLGSKGKPEEKKDMKALLDPKNFVEPPKTPACLTIEEATDLVRLALEEMSSEERRGLILLQTQHSLRAAHTEDCADIMVDFILI